jgi:transcriptional regulator with XRE-family HTH domain
MHGSFGARLRQQREERQIDLVAICEQTKIKLSLLEALERDDVSEWPSGIFRRGYVRTYAQFIGLDPDVIVREFLESHPDPGDVFVMTAATAAAAEEAHTRNAAASVRFRTIVDSALGSLSKLRRPAGIPPSTAAVGAAPVDEPVVAQAPEPVPGPPHFEQRIEQGNVAVRPAAEIPAAPLFDVASYADTSRALVDGTPAPEATPASADRMTLTGAAPARADSTPTADDLGPERAAPPPMPDTATLHDAGTKEAESTRADQPSAGEIAIQLQTAHDSTLETVARLCTELGRVVDQNEVQQLLQDAARIMNATGLIVWLSNEIGDGLRPALAHGYSDNVLAHLPTVKRDDDNATAAAFRTGVSCEVAAAAATSAAIVVPLLMPEACAGVLAVELQPGMQPTKPLRAIAVLLAAALMQLVNRSEAGYERTRLEATARTVAQ